MKPGSLPNMALLISVVGAVVLINFSLLLFPLWFLGFAMMPVMLLVALSVRTDQGTIRALNVLLCLYVLVFPIWPHYSAFKITGLPAINPQRVLYLLIMVISAFGFFSSAYQRRLFSSRAAIAKPELFLLGLFLLWQFLSCFRSSTTLFSLFLFFRDFILNVLILFSVMSCVRGEEDVKKVISFLAVGAAVVAALTIVEGVLKRNLFSGWLPVTSEYQLWAMTERFREGSYRAQGTFDYPLLLIEFLSLAFPAAIYLWRISKSRLFSLLGLGATLGIPVAMLLSGSRSAFVVLAVEIASGIGFLALRRIFSRRASVWPFFVMVSLLLVTTASIFILPMMADIITGRNMDEIGSTSARLAMIRRGVPLMGEEPILGYGFGRGAEMIGIAMGSFYVLDNYFLTVGLDSGVPALLAFVGFVALLLQRAIRLAVSENDTRAPLAMTLLIGLIGFLVVKLINSQDEIFPLMFVAAGLLWGLSSLQAGRPTKHAGRTG